MVRISHIFIMLLHVQVAQFLQSFNFRDFFVVSVNLQKLKIAAIFLF